MNPSPSQLKQLAIAWKKAAPKLAAARRADIRRQNNAKAIESLNSLFRETIRKSKPRKTSGLVQMYQAFSRLSSKYIHA